MSFDDLIALRKAEHAGHSLAKDGIENLHWIIEDTGAFDGPLMDWDRSHREKVKAHCRNFHSVVVAGGNCGMYPKLYSKLFEYVYTFEPDGLNFHCLALNCQEQNVYKFNVALGDRPNLVALNRHSKTNTGMHQIVDHPLFRGNDDHVPQPNISEETIPVMTLDSLKFDRLGLIHLDVEGYEGNVLNGAHDTIMRHKPMLMLENGDKYESELVAMGYRRFEKSAADTIYLPSNL